ncbi:MAG: hypothetical protein SWY16_06510 [Cyanobacteriota bacterium]|nr:hypothetical protein [Cyanobacteriota bacterium]
MNLSELPDLYQNYSLSRIHGDWALFVMQSHRLNDQRFCNEVLLFARQIMRRVRENIVRIVERLDADGYRFVDRNMAYKPPNPNTFEWIQILAEAGIYLPLSLQAWYLEVGSVNLMGSHPNWSKPGYLFDGEERTNDVWYTDPLFVTQMDEDYISYLQDLRDEWRKYQESNRYCRSKTYPFRIPIGLDRLHKANVSGGLPYEIDATLSKVDAFILNERNCTSFMGYIRLALQWGGFPGFLYIRESNFENWLIQNRLGMMEI